MERLDYIKLTIGRISTMIKTVEHLKYQVTTDVDIAIVDKASETLDELIDVFYTCDDDETLLKLHELAIELRLEISNIGLDIE